MNTTGVPLSPLPLVKSQSDPIKSVNLLGAGWYGGGGSSYTGGLGSVLNNTAVVKPVMGNLRLLFLNNDQYENTNLC